MLKLLERNLDGRITAVVEEEIGEKQQEFLQGRGEEDMIIGFIDLEKAYDTIPIEMAVEKKLRWIAVQWVKVRMVGWTHEDIKSRVLCGPGVQESSHRERTCENCRQTCWTYESVDVSNIVAITETWLTNKDSDLPVTRALTPPGYNLIHHPRCSRRGGGIAILHKESVKATSLKKFSNIHSCIVTA